METAEIEDEQTHIRPIKLPAAVEVFANLKNAQKFAIDIGMYCISNYLDTLNNILVGI